MLLDWDGFVSGKAWFDSGKTIMTGLVGGYFGVEAAKWALDITIKTGDNFAAPVAVAIAVAVGRLACFMGRFDVEDVGGEKIMLKMVVLVAESYRLRRVGLR